MILIANIKSSPPIDWTNSNNLYIGRKNIWNNLEESKWHNPFFMKNERERIKVLKEYLAYITQSKLIDDLHELDNKTLFCWCTPKKCHGRILVLLRELQLENRLDNLEEINNWIESNET